MAASAAIQYMEQKYNSTIQQFLDPSTVLEEIRMFLANDGYEYDKEGKASVVTQGEPLVNKKGIHVFMSIIKSHINTAVVQANLEQDQITKIMLELNEDMIDLLTLRHQEFDVKKEHFDILVDMVDHQCEAFLSRTKNDGERDRFKQNVKIVDNSANQQQKQVPGV